MSLSALLLVLRWLVAAVGGLAVLVTLLPLIPSNQWWIRLWDFPRIQIAVLLTTVLVMAPFLCSRRHLTWVFLALTAGALAWQLYGIWPYTPLHSIQAKAAPHCDDKSRVRLLVANVLNENRNADTLFNLVDEVRPDLLLLVETGAWWDRELAPLKDAYPQLIAHPMENSYGIHLLSRFELIEPEVRFLVEDDVPSIKTRLLLPSGRADHILWPAPQAAVAAGYRRA